MVLLLSREDVEKVITMKETIDAVEQAFKEFSQGTAVMPPRQVITIPDRGGWVGIMPAYIRGMEALATKVVTVFTENVSKFSLPTTMASIVVNDSETGEPLSIMDGGLITAMRTGAASGVATKYLSLEDSEDVGVFGAGVQARTQLMGVCEVRRVKRAKVYDLVAKQAEDYAIEMSRRLGIDVIVVDTPLQAVKDCDIIVTASTSPTPVFKGEWIGNGTHINCIGSHTKDTRELDTFTIKKSKLMVDSREAALKEIGDILIPISEGAITPNYIYGELGEVVAGMKKGRESRDETTVFKSTGLAVQDAATAITVYRKAREAKLGLEFRFT